MAVTLAHRPDVERLYCLVRAENDASATQRLERVFQFHGDAFDAKRVFAVAGDLADKHLAEKLGSRPELKGVDTIIHSAADTSFSPARTESVEKINIGGTRQMLSWATSLPWLDTFVYVGTASICGSQLANTHVYEDQSPNPKAKHLVHYTYTKMVGEEEVRRMIPAERRLIVRPSIIMGDSRDWKPRSYVILWAMAVMDAIRLIPANPNSNLDIIPVDFTAEAIVKLLFARRRFDTYHISAGKASATNVERVLRTIDEPWKNRPEFQFVDPGLIRLMKKWPKRLKNPNELGNFREHLDYWHTRFNGDFRVLVTGLDPYIRFIELNQTFDNSRLSRIP